MKEEVEILPKETFKELSSRIIEILRMPETKDYKTRLHIPLRNLLNLYKNKLHINDIPQITKLLLVSFDKCLISEEYLNYFFDILKLCSEKFKIKKPDDALTMIENVQNLFSALGFLLGSTKKSKITDEILISLTKMAKIIKDSRSFLYKEVFVEGLTKSELPEILVELLQIAEQNQYHNILKVVKSLLISNRNCQAFIKLDTFNIIMNKLFMRNFTNTGKNTYKELISCKLPDHIYTTTNILFALVDAFSKSSSTFKNQINNDYPLTRFSWKCFGDVFFVLIAKNEQKLRNNYFLLITLLSRVFKVDCALSRLDGHHLIFATENIYDSWISQIHFQPDDLDFEFKIFLLTLLGSNCPHDEREDLLRRMKAISGLIKLINLDVNLIWTDGQRNALMKYALITINHVVREVLDEFLHENGPKILLNVLRFALQDKYPINLILPGLRCIRTTLDGNLKNIDLAYRKEKILTFLLNCLKSLNSLAHITSKNQYCLMLIYCVLIRLTINNEEETPEIIKISFNFIKRYLTPSPDDVFLQPNGLIAIFDFLWENIVEHKQILNQFISEGGVYILMDVIESFPMAIKLFGLSILTDLCAVGGLPCILTWRGKTGDTLIPLLMKIYRQQCKFDKEFRTRCTIKTGHSKVVNNKYKQEINTGKSSLTCLDTLGNCKPKIHAILIMLNCHRDFKLVRNSYKLNQSLNYKDKLTFLLAEYYLPLKVGETWTEINGDFERAGIRPLAFDKEVVIYNIRRYRELLNFIKYEQKKLLLEQELKDKQDELYLYNELKESVLLDSLEALKELKYHAFCTESLFRLPVVSRMRHKISSLQSTSKDILIRYHSTIPRANVTFFCGQRFMIDQKADTNWHDEDDLTKWKEKSEDKIQPFIRDFEEEFVQSFSLVNINLPKDGKHE